MYGTWLDGYKNVKKEMKLRDNENYYLAGYDSMVYFCKDIKKSYKYRRKKWRIWKTARI